MRVRAEAGALLFSVGANGPGFDTENARCGHDFVSMLDRMGAIGGTIRWASMPGRGSTISGSVPVS